MMERSNDEFAGLEDRLRRRTSAVDPQRLKPRVMAAVVEELATARSGAAMGNGWFMASVAAAAVILINLGLIVASASQPMSLTNRTPADVRYATAMIENMEIGMPHAEARRIAVLLSVGEELVPLPVPAPQGPARAAGYFSIQQGDRP